MAETCKNCSCEEKEYKIDKKKIILIIVVWMLILFSLILASNGHVALSLLSIFVSGRIESHLRGAINIYKEIKCTL